MDFLTSIWEFVNSPVGAGVFFGLWIISESLASIPAVKANSVFQLVYQFLSRFKNQPSVIPILLIASFLMVSGCGKTLDQIKQAAHSIIDIAGKVYEDTKDNAETVKDTAKDIVKPSENK